MELQQSLAEYERNGISLFALSYDPSPLLAAFSAKHGITYTLFSDVGSHVIQSLGLLNRHAIEQARLSGVEPNPRLEGLPYPGTFVLNEQGVVMEKRFFPLHRERETGRALLELGFGVTPSPSGAVVSTRSEGVSVQAELDSQTYRYHQRLWLKVRIIPGPGLHIYAHPVPEGFVAATVTIESVEGITVGDQQWPQPHPMRISGLDEEFLVYEGQLTVHVPLTFLTREGDHAVRVLVTYQACSDHDCLLPQKVALSIPVGSLPHAEG